MRDKYYCIQRQRLKERRLGLKALVASLRDTAAKMYRERGEQISSRKAQGDWGCRERLLLQLMGVRAWWCSLGGASYHGGRHARYSGIDGRR
jgi:hypothetical protein